MALWAMLIGMVTLINITMVGAITSLAGNIPDSSFLAILSRYLGGRDLPAGAVLYPLEAASRLEGLRRKTLMAAAVCAAVAAGLTLWALAAGWGAVVMSAITLWVLAANAAFLEIPLGIWRRRAAGIREEGAEEASSKPLTESRGGGAAEKKRDADTGTRDGP